MLIDISEGSWEMFLRTSRKAMAARVIWYSPKEKNPYQIEDVTEKVIIRRGAGGNDENLGKKGYLHFLQHLNDNDGRFSRKTYGKSSVAKMTCIVALHPCLKWSDDNEYIEVVTEQTKGIINYTDFGEPPDDDITQLQTFARKVRRGQVAFRQALLNKYNSTCFITGTKVEEILDACHIEPHSRRGKNCIGNGLLLRTDIHTLFDLLLLFIEPNTYKIWLHPKLKNTEYYQYNGVVVFKNTAAPDGTYLEERWLEKGW